MDVHGMRMVRYAHLGGGLGLVAAVAGAALLEVNVATCGWGSRRVGDFSRVSRPHHSLPLGPERAARQLTLRLTPSA